MRKLNIVFYLLLVAVFCSCSKSQKLQYADCPVILIAEIERDSIINGGILLKCGDGEIIESSAASFFGASISNTYNVGDTIKHCN